MNHNFEVSGETGDGVYNFPQTTPKTVVNLHTPEPSIWDNLDAETELDNALDSIDRSDLLGSYLSKMSDLVYRMETVVFRAYGQFDLDRNGLDAESTDTGREAEQPQESIFFEDADLSILAERTEPYRPESESFIEGGFAGTGLLLDEEIAAAGSGLYF